MQAFKATLLLISRARVYLLIYIVLFGLLGIVMSLAYSNTGEAAGSEGGGGKAQGQAQAQPMQAHCSTVAVIDRDDSAASHALADFVASRADVIELQDDQKAIQDAAAFNLSPYIVIVPSGWGSEFLEAARSGRAAPELECVVNFAASEAVYMELALGEYLCTLRSAAALMPDAAPEAVLGHARMAALADAEAGSVTVANGAALYEAAVYYFGWIAYPMTIGISLLTAMVFSCFLSGELRRRNLCSPLSPTAMSVQIGAGSVAIVLMTWVFLVLLSLLPPVGGVGLAEASPDVFGLLLLAALAYALVPLAIGFLLGQLGFKEMLNNGIANTLALAFCFLSGIFMGDAAILGETVQAIGRFTPTYWYLQATQAFAANGADAQAMGVYMPCVGIILLFAAAIFAVGLLAGRWRAQRGGGGE